MLPTFLTILFGVLAGKAHELLRDEVIAAVYDMAAVDFDGFYRSVRPRSGSRAGRGSRRS